MPFALGVMGTCACILAGCGKEEAAKPDPSSPASYMNDTNFTGRLETLRAERVELAQRRETIVRQMKAMVDAKRAALKTSDDAKVKAALEQDPEWKELYRRCQDANTAITEQRRKAMGEVRARIAPQKPISK